MIDSNEELGKDGAEVPAQKDAIALNVGVVGEELTVIEAVAVVAHVPFVGVNK